MERTIDVGGRTSANCNDKNIYYSKEFKRYSKGQHPLLVFELAMEPPIAEKIECVEIEEINGHYAMVDFKGLAIIAGREDLVAVRGVIASNTHRLVELFEIINSI
ncbi:MAG TPA: hypothetical protein VMQ44_01280 [Candidatus Saccharimonadales bacterium]|nr:hypothetical protein [Candidatus Saccharimonadales bacterium]